MSRICLLKWNLDETGGGVKVAIDLANELSLKHDVFLVNIASKNLDSANLPFKLGQNVRFDVLVNNSPRVRNVLLSGILALRKFLKANKIQVLISVGTMPNPFWFFARIGLDIKVIFSDHMSFEFNQNGRLFNIYRYLGSRSADKVITLTKANTESYIKHYNLMPEKVDYIYNWVENGLTNGAYDIKSKSLITVARFSPQKGFDLLAIVAKKILQDNPDWTWHIYGDGQEDIKESFIRSLVADNIDSQVILHGNVDGKDNIYPHHGIFVMTSYYEGLPLVLLEAQQYHLPIVSFDCPTGPSEIVVDSQNGFLITPYDTTLLSEKVQELIDDVSLREIFSKNAFLEHDKFSKEKIIGKWNKLFEELQSIK